MNAKTLGGLIVALLLVGALVVVFNQQKSAPQSSVTPTESVDVTVDENEQDGASEMKEETVTVTEDGFTPQTLTVKKGTKVTWVNNSGASVQVSSSPHPQHTDYPAMNQRTISDGEEVSFTFEEVGTYKYHDHLNASNFGSVTVEE